MKRLYDKNRNFTMNVKPSLFAPISIKMVKQKPVPSVKANEQYQGPSILPSIQSSTVISDHEFKFTNLKSKDPVPIQFPKKQEL